MVKNNAFFKSRNLDIPTFQKFNSIVACLILLTDFKSLITLRSPKILFSTRYEYVGSLCKFGRGSTLNFTV